MPANHLYSGLPRAPAEMPIRAKRRRIFHFHVRWKARCNPANTISSAPAALKPRIVDAKFAASVHFARKPGSIS